MEYCFDIIEVDSKGKSYIFEERNIITNKDGEPDLECKELITAWKIIIREKGRKQYYSSDHIICDKLGIKIWNWRDWLKENGAREYKKNRKRKYAVYQNNELYWKNREEIQEAIGKIEGQIVMYKLLK